MSLTRRKGLKQVAGSGKLDFSQPPSPSLGTPTLETSSSELPNFESRALMNFTGADVMVSADDLDLVRTLGRGQYGQVDKWRVKQTGFALAVKRIRATDDPEERKRMMTDVEVNRDAGGKCPYIVRSYGTLFRDGDLWICMEVMDDSLDGFYRKVFAAKQTIPENVLSHIAFAIISGLQFLKRELHILHRDVKPSNVLLSRNGDVKVCDFGISGKMVQSMAKTRAIGCAPYMPPERIDPSSEGTEGFGVQSDVWSVGITMIEVATGKHPFESFKSPFQQMNAVVGGPAPTLPSGFSDDFRDFINRCCQKRSIDRPKYEELLEHPFINRGHTKESAVSAFVSFIEPFLSAAN